MRWYYSPRDEDICFVNNTLCSHTHTLPLLLSYLLSIIFFHLKMNIKLFCLQSLSHTHSSEVNVPPRGHSSLTPDLSQDSPLLLASGLHFILYKHAIRHFNAAESGLKMGSPMRAQNRRARLCLSGGSCCAEERCDGVLCTRERAAVSRACDGHSREHIWLKWFLSQWGAAAEALKACTHC